MWYAVLWGVVWCVSRLRECMMVVYGVAWCGASPRMYFHSHIHRIHIKTRSYARTQHSYTHFMRTCAHTRITPPGQWSRAHALHICTRNAPSRHTYSCMHTHTYTRTHTRAYAIHHTHFPNTRAHAQAPPPGQSSCARASVLARMQCRALAIQT